MSGALPVLVNASGGAARKAGEGLRAQVEAAFSAAGVIIALELINGGEMIGRVASLAPEHDRIVVGGGDGTLGSAAQVLAGTGIALGLLPLGTRNHLAIDLGIPADLNAAATVIASGWTRPIDIVRVNDRTFVNNASIGVYPSLVSRRDAVQAAHGLPKWLAAVPATIKALARIRHHRLRLQLPGSDERVATPLLFVGNNRYSIEPGSLGKRAALDHGVMSIYALPARRRRALVALAARILIGRADPAQTFAAVGEARELTVSSHARSIAIALDGEVTRLDLPLSFRVDGGSLIVIAPEPDAD